MTDLHGYLDFRDMFREAMNPAFYNIGFLDRLVGAGKTQFFRSDNAAIVTEIKTFPTGTTAVHGLVAAGNIPEIKHLIARAESWGRLNGCAVALIESHPAWQRIMRDEGYRPFQVSIVKEL